MYASGPYNRSRDRYPDIPYPSNPSHEIIYSAAGPAARRLYGICRLHCQKGDRSHPDRPRRRQPQRRTPPLHHHHRQGNDDRHHDRRLGPLPAGQPAGRTTAHRRGAVGRLQIRRTERHARRPLHHGTEFRTGRAGRRRRRSGGRDRPQLGHPQGDAVAGQHSQQQAVRTNKRRHAGRRSEFPAGRARRGRMSELRLRAGTHQRSGRPLFANPARLAAALLGPQRRLRSRTDSRQHDRARGGDPRRRIGALRRVGHRRHDQHHHQGAAARLGRDRPYAHVRGMQRRLRQQHDDQRLAGKQQPQGGHLRLRAEPLPFGLRPRRRRLHRTAQPAQPDVRHALLPAHGRPLEADARIPRHQRVPPRRKPARPAGARSQHHRADRSQHQRRVGGLRPLLARRPHAPPERLLGRAADHTQELLRRHGRRRDRRRARKRPQSLRPHRRTDGHQRRAVPATIRTAAVSPLRTDARRGAQLRPHRRRDDRLRHAHESSAA